MWRRWLPVYELANLDGERVFESAQLEGIDMFTGGDRLQRRLRLT